MDKSPRISIDPDICHGKPCIKGTRIPVYLILEMLEYGMSFHDVIEEYPHITEEDIKACLHFARILVDKEEITPFVSLGNSA